MASALMLENAEIKKKIKILEEKNMQISNMLKNSNTNVNSNSV